MPETPVYGIVYPCSGDTINTGVFAAFASSLDGALAQGIAELAQATGRPNAEISAFLPLQAVTVNVVTTLIFDTESYDNDGMANLAINNDRLTIQTSGAYLVRGAFATGSATTMTSAAVILTVNGVERGRSKTRPLASQNSSQIDYCIPMSLVAGDVVRAQALWTGTGGPSNFSIRILSASYLAAPTV